MRSHETLKAFQLPLHRIALCLDCEMCSTWAPAGVRPVAVACGHQWLAFFTGDISHE
jgi:hypothetical protein